MQSMSLARQNALTDDDDRTVLAGIQAIDCSLAPSGGGDYSGLENHVSSPSGTRIALGRGVGALCVGRRARSGQTAGRVRHPGGAAWTVERGDLSLGTRRPA